jgi:hypothetical protein
MKRSYYKEPDTKYGRPKTRISKKPPESFRNYDDEMKGWDARRFLREIQNRLGKHAWRQEWGEDWEGLTPVTDPDEINAFLCRPSAVTQVASKEDAEHALKSGMILIAVDPNTPDLRKRLEKEVAAIRNKHPLPIKGRGRPGKTTDVAGIEPVLVDQWRAHRIIALLHLQLSGHDPRTNRKQAAEWMFPEEKDQRKRGLKLDRALELLDQAIAACRMIDAQTR